MESIISSLMNRYESGSLSRRELIRGLAMLTAAGTMAGTTQADTAIHVTGIHHVSVQVSNLERSVKFYQDAFGLPFLNEDKKMQTVRLKCGIGNVSIRQINPPGTVDHFAMGVQKLDKAAVTEEMKQHGINTIEGEEPLTFHVVDPDGYPVQMISTP